MAHPRCVGFDVLNVDQVRQPHLNTPTVVYCIVHHSRRFSFSVLRTGEPIKTGRPCPRRSEPISDWTSILIVQPRMEDAEANEEGGGGGGERNPLMGAPVANPVGDYAEDFNSFFRERCNACLLFFKISIPVSSYLGLYILVMVITRALAIKYGVGATIGIGYACMVPLACIILP